MGYSEKLDETHLEDLLDCVLSPHVENEPCLVERHAVFKREAVGERPGCCTT